MASPAATLPLAPPSAMPLQRRYSVTGQTPPDHVGAIKSPKLQALDTSVQTAGCNLCESCGARDAGRTSSKRSATHMPSPSTPSSQGLPAKVARLGLEHDGPDSSSGGDDGCFSDDLIEESDYALSSRGTSPPTSLPSPADPKPADVYFSARHPTVLAAADPCAPTLCSLPPEIRHHIYLQLPDLVLPYPLIYCLSTFADKKQHPLASVSRLVRSEALAIFYSYNTWVIKVEFRLMYDAFQEWIIRLGDGASSLRLVVVAVRGSLFKPRRSHRPATLPVNRTPGPALDEYAPPDGDASFRVDLSEKYAGGKVVLLRNDGTSDAGETARIYLGKLVAGLWEKKTTGTVNGQDWVNLVDQFLAFVGYRA